MDPYEERFSGLRPPCAPPGASVQRPLSALSSPRWLSHSNSPRHFFLRLFLAFLILACFYRNLLQPRVYRLDDPPRSNWVRWGIITVVSPGATESHPCRPCPQYSAACRVQLKARWSDRTTFLFSHFFTFAPSDLLAAVFTHFPSPPP